MVALPKLIIITGPTASGKTEAALQLAKKFNGEIISADSRQVYRGLDIGTAKPPISHAPRSGASAKSSAPLNNGAHPVIVYGIPHYLINIRNPNQTYTLGHFKKDAIKTIQDITRRDKIPFLVGGTALYINVLINNLEIPKVKPNPKLRRQLEKQINTKGLDYVYRKLLKIDPETARIFDPHNPRRVIRALEIALATKKPFSETRRKGQPLFDYLILGISLPDKILKKRIEKRTAGMLKRGLLQEVKKLAKKYGARRPAFDAIGYRELIAHLQNKPTLPEAIALINKNTWRFAKRQMTWFRRLPVIWIKNGQQAKKEIKKFLTAD